MPDNKEFNSPASEITPQTLFNSRRQFMRLAAATAAVGVLPGMADAKALPKLHYTRNKSLSTSETKTTPYDVTHYTNFYEFDTSKFTPYAYASQLKTRPWTITIDGEVKKRKVVDIDRLIKLAPLEERIYRMRCVEGWAMVIPWLGYPLSKLLKQVQLTSRAKYVEFISLEDPLQMPNQQTDVLQWPYREGLRLDEAMNPLTLLTVGLYGERLPNQNGAPVRVVVPWKYGFKSPKSIVQIRLVEYPTTTSWMLASPTEYGFYANVNPLVDHPRWSQATEQRIGEHGRRDTLLFNGYGKYVEKLYIGMNLVDYF
ncbi:MAG: protein-methionine-sulfoxide reductase catalytic subunit MsrP [Methylococcales bacterium]|nr:protein-methionine-sulfoxide reductase catalytic subunit MsrP [Methylococcales bacterium]